jgi:hypothetical protein
MRSVPRFVPRGNAGAAARRGAPRFRSPGSAGRNGNE